MRGFDGAEHLAEAVVQTPLGTSYTHEDFCEKVVIVLVEQQILDSTLVRSIVDCIHLRKFAVQEVVPPGSNVECRDLPEPNFGMIASICSRRHRYCISG